MKRCPAEWIRDRIMPLDAADSAGRGNSDLGDSCVAGDRAGHNEG